MANTKKWVITDLEVKPTVDTLTDVVAIVHWRRQAEELVGEDKVILADMYGACSINLPEADAFIPFEELTKEIVIGWLESTLDMSTIDASLDINIDTQKNPPVVTKRAPWITEPESTNTESSILPS